jgi:hypothetical protein
MADVPKDGMMPGSFEIETEDVSKAILDYAKKYALDPKMLDFKIVSVNTIAFNETDKSLAIFDTSRNQPISAELFMDEHIKFYQKFSISICGVEEQPVVLDMPLSADKLFTKVIATIKKESKLIYYPNLDRFIYEEINKKLARNKILVSVFEVALKKEIDALVTKLKDGAKLDEDYKLTVAESNDYIPSEDDKITFYFEEKKKLDSERPDFYNRGFIVGVEEGEILAEYKKPKEGRSGRDTRGRYIKVLEPKNTNEPQFKVSENIRVEETPSITRFIAAKVGFVVYDGSTMDIQEELKIDKIDFRKTGSIIVDEDKDITLDISEADPVVDAIGSNMTARATEVIVRGSIADNSKVYAQKVQIKGLTHATSKVYAQNAEITTHRGYLEAKEVNIERLEGGEIIADVVHVGHANSGKIVAKKVYITNLGSNCSITASSLVDITAILGSDNKFFFEAGATPSEKEMFTKAVAKEAELSKMYADKHDEFRKTIRLVEDNKESAMKIKKMIDEDIKKGFQPKEAFVFKYKQFTQMLTTAKALKVEYDELKEAFEEVSHEVATFEDKLLDARLVNHGIWRNFQTVIFLAHGGKKPCKFVPAEGSRAKEIGLFKLSDTEYSAGEVR